MWRERVNLHRSEKPRGKQRRVRFVRFHVGKRIFRGVGLFISDQSIDPGIGHLDSDLILTLLESATDIYTIRRMPYDAERFAVDDDLG